MRCKLAGYSLEPSLIAGCLVQREQFITIDLSIKGWWLSKIQFNEKKIRNSGGGDFKGLTRFRHAQSFFFSPSIKTEAKGDSVCKVIFLGINISRAEKQYFLTSGSITETHTKSNNIFQFDILKTYYSFPNQGYYLMIITITTIVKLLLLILLLQI